MATHKNTPGVAEVSLSTLLFSLDLPSKRITVEKETIVVGLLILRRGDQPSFLPFPIQNWRRPSPAQVPCGQQRRQAFIKRLGEPTFRYGHRLSGRFEADGDGAGDIQTV